MPTARAHLGQAHHVERPHGQLEALACLTEQGDGLQHHVVEEQLDVGRAAQPHHGLVLAHGQAGQGIVHQEHRDLFAAGLVACFGRHQEEIAPQAIADEVLATVEHPAAVGLLARRGADALGVRARARFGDGDGAGALAPHRGAQPAFDLCAAALQQRLVDVAEGAADEDVAGVAELLFAEDAVHRAEAAAAVLGGHVQGVEAEGAGFGEDGAGRVGVELPIRLDALLQRLQLGLDEATHGLDHHLLFVVQGDGHGHVSRGNAGNLRMNESDINGLPVVL